MGDQGIRRRREQSIQTFVKGTYTHSSPLLDLKLRIIVLGLLQSWIDAVPFDYNREQN
jgi:hypothetical protein